MIAGVPGAGISAFFYLLWVLAMPLVALRRALASRSARSGRWGLVTRMFTMGVAIVAALVAGGWLASALLPAAPQAQASGGLENVAVQTSLALGRVGFLIGLGTLGLVVGTVHALAGADRWRRRARERSIESRPTVRADLSAVWSTSAVRLPGRVSAAPVVLGLRPIARQTLYDPPVLRMPAPVSASQTRVAPEPRPVAGHVPAWSGGPSMRATG